jgi:hypothetical protein
LNAGADGFGRWGWDSSIRCGTVGGSTVRGEKLDYIYGMVVLHLNPDCGQAFKVLRGLLRRRGRIALRLRTLHTARERLGVARCAG